MIARDSLNIETNQGEVLHSDKSRSNSVAGGRFMSRFWDTVKRTVTGDTAPPPELLKPRLPNCEPKPHTCSVAARQNAIRQNNHHSFPYRGRRCGDWLRVSPLHPHFALYQFPTADAPLLTFLDTRGVDEPGYDATEDIAMFDPQALSFW